VRYGQCGDGVSAAEKILELSPDLIFLDVQMPGMDGFEVLRAVPREKLPNVIFLTAYEQHALRAFEVHALDYLLKPVDDERFAAAIGRTRKLVESSLKTKMAERVLQMLDQTQEKVFSRFTVQTGEGPGQENCESGSGSEEASPSEDRGHHCHDARTGCARNTCLMAGWRSILCDGYRRRTTK
jgi:YesN/AraC family two-component response regulator